MHLLTSHYYLNHRDENFISAYSWWNILQGIRGNLLKPVSFFSPPCMNLACLQEMQGAFLFNGCPGPPRVPPHSHWVNPVGTHTILLQRWHYNEPLCCCVLWVEAMPACLVWCYCWPAHKLGPCEGSPFIKVCDFCISNSCGGQLRQYHASHCSYRSGFQHAMLFGVCQSSVLRT